MSAPRPVERISQELIALLGTDRQVEPYSRRDPTFGLAEAYDVVARVAALRRDRGEHPVGRKIGFTNRSIWGNLGISAPVWNYVFDRTVHWEQTKGGLSGMPEPRIEPELVLHLAEHPGPEMSDTELSGCIDWIAPGYEVVYSIFPDWAFSAADAAAAYGVHGALYVGDKFDVSVSGETGPPELSSFVVELENNIGVRRNGHARNVLGGPLHALRFLVEEIARYPGCEPLRAGEIVTTGTLTEAMPARVGETWTARFEGIQLPPLRLTFV